ncbi:efflux RND transporter permease subunit, partial [Comamonas aquatica]|uniref:efflux RND transporter permease subunit n=1 Tax=Comamonas aquatica TaxID=225991 RepID=UPI003D07AF56
EKAMTLRGEGIAQEFQGIVESYVQRRWGAGACPKVMTVAVILAGLVPIVWSSGTGSEVMSRIAAPMLGGMVTAPLLSLFVIPAAYLLMRKPR